jgi:uncharacterized membrane protein
MSAVSQLIHIARILQTTEKFGLPLGARDLDQNCYERSFQMDSMKQGIGLSLIGFLKTTIMGGLLFLLPIVVVVIVLGQALQLARKVAQPISKLLPDVVLGIGGITVLAVLVLVLFSFLAGLVAHTNTGKRIMQQFENSILGNIPQYQLMKSMAEGLAKVESAEGVKPVLVSVDGGWQIGYVLEELENGWVAVLLPQAPTPMSGNVMYLPSDRVRPLGITMVQAMAVVKRMGVGSGNALRGADLTLPVGA